MICETAMGHPQRRDRPRGATLQRLAIARCLMALKGRLNMPKPYHCDGGFTFEVRANRAVADFSPDHAVGAAG